MNLKEAKELVKAFCVIAEGTFEDPYTHVVVEYEDDDGAFYTEHGFSKRNPKDAPNQKRGFDIACGRAAVKIARRLCSQYE